MNQQKRNPALSPESASNCFFSCKIKGLTKDRSGCKVECLEQGKKDSAQGSQSTQELGFSKAGGPREGNLKARVGDIEGTVRKTPERPR